MPDAPFLEGAWSTIGRLRDVAAEILRDRQGDKDYSAKLRTQNQKDIPWAKSWNEELYPLKVLADHMNLADHTSFCWTPSEAADFEVRTDKERLKVQCTMAYAERQGTIGKQGGHVCKLEMAKYNADGFCFGGGLVTEPRARSAEDDAEAWRLGIKCALIKKLRPAYTGCRLLIFALRCQFDTIDFGFDHIVVPAVEEVGREAWEAVFDGLYVCDEPTSAFTQFCRGS